MASKYPIQKEDQDLVSTDKYLDESGHWTVPPGGSSKLSELEDVELTDIEDGQTLIYNSETQKFENGDGGSGSDPEYEYSYWREHRAEIEATGKRFIVKNAPPSPDLTAENIGYGNSNVGAALDALNVVKEGTCTHTFTIREGVLKFRQIGRIVSLFNYVAFTETLSGNIQIGNLPNNISKPLTSAYAAACFASNFALVEVKPDGSIWMNLLGGSRSGYLFLNLTYVV